MTSARFDDPALQLARQTRERFVASTEAAIEAVAQAVRERLDHQAMQSATAREMQQHRDNQLAFRGAEMNWVSQSRLHWRKALDESQQGSSGGSGSGLLSMRLELVGDEVVENNILSSRLALAVQDKANFDLNDLRLRIQHLERRDDLDARDVLKPEVLPGVLVAQWLAAGMGRELWLAVREVLHASVAEAMATAYKEANTFLIGQGVMPEIDLKRLVRRPVSGPASSPGALGGRAQTGPGTTVVSARPGAGAGAAPSQPQAAAPMGFAPAAIGVQAAAPGTQPEEAMLPRGASPFELARHRAQGMLMNLRRLVEAAIGGSAGWADSAPQRTNGGESGIPMVPAHAAAARAAHAGAATLPAPVHPAFAAAVAQAGAEYHARATSFVLTGDPAAAAALVQRSAAELRRHANDLKKQAPTTADKATVEIVALMFQAILAEERIPFSARVWFARLQMPVLRVAIAEPQFFATLQHPARMLIDRMGSVVMGFDAAAISGSALENEIRRVVQVIEQYPETGQRVFKLVYDEFVAFLSKYLTQNDATQRAMSVAQQVEQKETMAIQYTIELRKMLNDMPVREEIREFLFKVWAEVLAMAAIKYGAQDEQTVVFKRAASELVWAASAKPSRTDRARVIQELPKLLQRLRQGLELLGVTGSAQEAHIKIIGKTLSDAFMSKTATISAEQIEAMASRLANLEDYVGEEGDAEMPIDVASVELLLGVDAASIEVLPSSGAKVEEGMLAWAHELQVGSWHLLDHNGRPSQVQFVWRSERKRLYLFAANDGRKFMLQAGRLAAYLQAGLLRPAEEESLTARATRKALAKLDANPERLLN
ncbi:DUF1631 family protein [Xenophilus arseniciresistens]|uniref:DUF1631 family protein n=1 Tax=Xenophilus arseniciresistens TaxID=1283306 RepID=A0AAE3NBH1_9BURK|nr:DUF1631 family protein [Xenophilus arseniciresistens]MDA7418473.1 DUF1631 family protein [Xenophilus arseniciresistens]